MQPGERLAVIDLGSNSFRLVVFMAGDGLVEAHRRDLRAGAHRRGASRPADSWARSRCGARWRRSTCSRTSAARAASTRTRSTRSRRARSATPTTRQDFPRARARALRGCRSACSAASRRPATATSRRSTRRRCRDGCVLDLGGGSLQLVQRRRAPGARVGLLAARHGAHERALPAAQRARQAQAAARSCASTSPASSTGAGWLAAAGARAGARLVGIGGTVRNLAAAAQRAAGLPSNGVQGMVIERDALDELVERLAALPARRARERAGHQAGARGPDPRRRVVVQGVLRAGGFDRARGDRGGPARGRVLRALLGGSAPEPRAGRRRAGGARRCSTTCAARAC